MFIEAIPFRARSDQFTNQSTITPMHTNQLKSMRPVRIAVTIITLGSLALMSGQLGLSSASAQNLLSNGDFKSSASLFTHWPGYLGQDGVNPPAIPDWDYIALGGAGGVNGSDTAATVFGPDIIPPNTDWGFLQGPGGWLQALPGLTPNRTYMMNFRAAVRSGEVAPTMRVQIGDATTVLVSSGDFANGSSVSFQPYSYTFTTPGSFDGVPSIQLYNLGGTTANYTGVGVYDITGLTPIPIWSGSVSGNLGGGDANFTSFTFAQAVAATNILYFGDTDGLGAGVLSSSLTTVPGGVSAPTFLFNNAAVSYSLASADATGITGSSVLVKNGSGTLTLSGANTYTGRTTVEAGTLQLNNANALSGTSEITVADNARLTLGAGSVTFANVPAFLTGNGGNSRGALHLIGNGPVVSWPGPITVNNATIGNFGVNGTYTFNNVISGSNGVTFFAGGGGVNHVLTVNLSGANTYSGPTVLAAYYGSSEQVNLFGGDNRLPAATDLTINDNWNNNYVTLDLGGNNQQVNTLTVDGGATAAANLTSSSGSPTLNIAPASGTAFTANGGIINISGITFTCGGSGDTATVLGGPGATATTVNFSNGIWNSSFYTDVGRAATTVLNITGGTFNNAGELLFGWGNSAGDGTLNANGGLLNANYIRLGTTAAGTLNVNSGGTVSANRIFSNVPGLGTINLDGGLLRVNSSPASPWFEDSVVAFVQSGGATIDTAGQSVSIVAPLQAGSGTGGLTKQGAGMLTLEGPCAYSGATTIINGALALIKSGSISSSPLISVSGGATFDVSGLSSSFVLGASQTLSNGASGTGILNGNLSTDTGTVAVRYASGTPSLTVTNGTLTLSASTPFAINNSGPMLAIGTYKIISKAASGNVGAVAGALPASVTVGGGGAAAAPALEFINGELYLAVGTFAPVVTTQPVGATRYVGGTITFTAAVESYPAAQLQWKHNTTSIADATKQTVTLTNLQLSDAGSYTLYATNSVGHTNTIPVTLTVLAASGYAGLVVTNNPMGYWRFSDGGGIHAYDYIGGNDGVDPLGQPLQAGPRPPAFAGFESTNTASFMNGANQGYATTAPLFNGLSAFTLMGWFKIDPSQYPFADTGTNGAHPQGRASLFGQQWAAELGFYQGTNLYFYAQGISSTIFVTSGFTPGQWCFVAAVSDPAAGATTIYLNGVAAGTAGACPGTVQPYLFSIGKNVTYFPESAFFPGSIDEVAAFDHALSASTIAEIYVNGSPGANTLSIGKSGSSLELTWSFGRLVTSTNLLNGPWLPVPGAISPQLVAPTGIPRFYRTVIP